MAMDDSDLISREIDECLEVDASTDVEVEVLDEGVPAKKARKPKSAGGSKPKEPKKKRGPPRPHRKLEGDVLELRMNKLKKRIDKAKVQLEDATRHIEVYQRESFYHSQACDC